MKIFLLWLMGACCACLLAACAFQDAGTAKTRLVVFGDGNVDTGNLFRLTNNSFPAAPNWKGRFSNGPIVIDYLAEALDAEIENYAIIGATTGESNIVPLVRPDLHELQKAGVSSQVDEFINSGEPLSTSDIVILWAGSNDIVQTEGSNPQGLKRQIDRAVSNLQTQIDRLSQRGAQLIIVATRTPRADLGSKDNQNGIDLNRALKVSVKASTTKDGTEVRLFDAYEVVSEMMKNPSRFGFTQVKQLCSEEPACAAEHFEEGLELANRYVNWDRAHKTTRVHRLMADKLLLLLQR